jgi:glycosyltransferase involved in cell wall biosynthesis
VSGFLAPPGDTATLARRLLELLSDRRLASRMAAAARETVRARYGAERVLAELEALYASLGLRAAGEPRADAPRVHLREAA